MLAARYEGWLEPDEGLPPPPVLTLPEAAPAPAAVALEPKPMPEPAPVIKATFAVMMFFLQK